MGRWSRWRRRTNGRVSGEPVALLHGLGCHRQTWDPVVPLLNGQREIIATDLRWPTRWAG
ncbi:hypothetical protein G5C60_03565 [Streptomyces sp. HC44]|uniref:Alpha/beta hydrolase n=1 Tax=Streptomyces scabichelini TaxID=2711217 RepID=A0A6G4UYT6_9ACTN|nr:hypothetical protein [Streptomyces scabichelini]NGO06764.1 hypothetical protein [Streptomyces scabichelini]